MATLTKEQKENYLKEGGGICPFCKSPDISGGQVQVEGTEAWQEVSCSDCDERWRDVYKLAFVETND